MLPGSNMLKMTTARNERTKIISCTLPEKAPTQLCYDELMEKLTRNIVLLATCDCCHIHLAGPSCC
jgi:hypothetical protein